MNDKIESRYYFDKNGTLCYSENWYDTGCLNFSEYYNDSLNAYSNLIDYCSIMDGENFNSIEGLFRMFVTDGQYNLQRLIDKLELTIDDYKDYTEVDESIESISELTTNELIDFLTDWYSEYRRIPAWIFTDTAILSENHPYYSTSCSITNYSSAGDTYWNPDNVDDDEPDFVFWVDRKNLSSIDNEDARYDQLKNSIKDFENWNNGYTFGLTTQTWDEQRDCWIDEYSTCGFLGDEYYNIEELINEMNGHEVKYVNNLEDTYFDRKPFPVDT